MIAPPPRFRIPWLILILALAGCGWSAYHFGWTSSLPAVPPAPTEYEIDGLVVAAHALNLGEVWENKELPFEIPIQNSTRADVQIRDFALSCGCLSVEPRSLTIPAGETKTINLMMDLTQRRPSELGQANRPFTSEITPLTQQGWPRKPGWKLHGVVNSRVTLNTLSLDFGKAPVSGQSVLPRKVIASLHVPAERIEAIVDPKIVSVRVVPHADEPSRFDLLIAPQPSLPPGAFKSELTIHLVTTTGERLRTATIPIAGHVQPEVRPLPARLLLGSKALGATAEAVMVLQIPPEVTVKLERIETDSPDVHIEPTVVEGSPPGRTFRVTQRVTKEGDQSSIVRLFYRKEGQGLTSVSMEVSYRGETITSLPECGDGRRNP